jgi:hypothetical protein
VTWFRQPITEYYAPDKPCARIRVWTVKDENGRRSSLQVDMSLSPALNDFFWALLGNQGRLTEDLLAKVTAECRELRLQHEDHHP